MCGRAGRPNYDDKGETVLIAASDFEASNVRDYYIYGEPEPIESQLLKTSNFHSHLLALISSTPGISLTILKIYSLKHLHLNKHPLKKFLKLFPCLLIFLTLRN